MGECVVCAGLPIQSRFTSVESMLQPHGCSHSATEQDVGHDIGGKHGHHLYHEYQA